MKFLKIIFFTGTLLFTALLTRGQDTLLVEALGTETALSVKWFPLDANIWLAGLTNGYRIERAQMDGESVSASTVLFNQLLPKDTAWFTTHKKELQGLIEPIGALLYDSTFQFEATEELDAGEMRYNFVVKEVQNFSEVAEAVGLGFTDSTVVMGKKYRYTIHLLGNAQTLAKGSVDLEAKDRSFSMNPKGIFLEFQFPGGRSLSQMRNPQPGTTPAVMGMVKAYGDSIVLRWGPNNPSLWSESNRLGYSIERKTGKEGTYEALAIVKPWPQDTLAGIIDNNKSALLAAAQLYSTEGEELAEGFNDLADIAENRWGFALYAAEQSTLAANLLGLRFVDKNVRPGEEYTYVVKSLAAPGLFSAAFLDITNDYTATPAPAGFQLVPGDSLISLIWDKGTNERNFSAYKIERSEDGGKSWKKMTENLLVFLEDPDVPLPNFSFVDSVGVNYKEFHYRLQGLTTFGDMSEFAEVKGEARDLTPPSPPKIIGVQFDEELQQATIQWEKMVLPPDFDGYLVMLSSKPEGAKYDTISNRIAAGQNQFIYKPDNGFTSDEAHYFRVLAIDKKGNTSASLEQYMHLADLTAPPPPAVFTGRIEDDGTVHLYWEHSEAKDVIGYWLFFANNENDEYRPLNTKPLVYNSYTYKIQEFSLNDVAYYMVLAEDRSNNRGLSSEVLKLKRPDKVPPIKPGFTNPNAYDGAIQVKWDKSPSDDVIKYHVFRKVYGSEEEWEKIRETNHIDSIGFADTNIIMDVLYEYKIQAEDASGNLSDQTLNFTARLPFEPEKIVVTDFAATPLKEQQSAHLKWSFELDPESLPPNVEWKLHLFKSDGNKNVELLDEVPPGTLEYIDPAKLLPGVIFNYAVQVVFSTGQIGKMSLVKSVMLE